MRRGSRLATRRWRASISRATSSTRSGTTPSLHARHNTPHVALNCACVLSMDEPDHTRLRSIVDEAFRCRAVLDMEPRIHAMADALAAELFAEGSPADLVERYARKLPLS